MKRSEVRSGLRARPPQSEHHKEIPRRGEGSGQVEEKIPERETSIRTPGERLQKSRQPSFASPSSPISTGFASSGLVSRSFFSLHSFNLLSDSCTCGPAPGHYYICTCFQSLHTALTQLLRDPLEGSSSEPSIFILFSTYILILCLTTVYLWIAETLFFLPSWLHLLGVYCKHHEVPWGRVHVKMRKITIM